MPSDQYDRMNTDQLEEQASQRGFDLAEFQGLKNNGERAQRLRDHDAATQASQDQAQANAEQARQAQDQQAAQQQQDQAARDQAARDQQAQQARQDQGADQGQASDSVQVDRGTSNTANAQAAQPDDRPADVAPYTSDRDQQNRVDAASGNVTAPPPYDEADVPPVGGQNTPTVDGRDQDLNPDQK